MLIAESDAPALVTSVLSVPPKRCGYDWRRPEEKLGLLAELIEQAANVTPGYWVRVKVPDEVAMSKTYDAIRAYLTRLTRNGSWYYYEIRLRKDARWIFLRAHRKDQHNANAGQDE